MPMIQLRLQMWRPSCQHDRKKRREVPKESRSYGEGHLVAHTKGRRANRCEARAGVLVCFPHLSLFAKPSLRRKVWLPSQACFNIHPFLERIWNRATSRSVDRREPQDNMTDLCSSRKDLGGPLQDKYRHVGGAMVI